ncbi:hypothetical protein DMA11_05205 [Marinilabiliaceae bacterium JC017]|nr:hypothetical protein DMA11_05205 [Marinilabiliaceae bacterium JC017]
MNKYLFLISLAFWAFAFSSCDNSSESGEKSDSSLVTLKIDAPETGYIYINGKYSGKKTPGEIKVTPGDVTVGIALENSRQYLRRSIKTEGETQEVNFNESDKQTPKKWKALWVGVHEVKGQTANGICSSRFTKEQLDAGYDFFEWSIENHFEKMSYGTMDWEIERKDVDIPLMLKRSSDGTWYTLEQDVVTAAIPEIEPGAYDCVFLFWREKEGSCDFTSPYFGLGWCDPLGDPIKTGFVTIKFNAKDDINKAIQYYKDNDPGVYMHEWLHTVGEKYFQSRGYSLPEKADDGFVVHAAEKYKYTYPWMNWYEDFVSGRVKDYNGRSVYYGIGPDAFLECSLRESATGDCDN